MILDLKLIKKKHQKEHIQFLKLHHRSSLSWLMTCIITNICRKKQCACWMSCRRYKSRNEYPSPWIRAKMLYFLFCKRLLHYVTYWSLQTEQFYAYLYVEQIFLQKSQKPFTLLISTKILSLNPRCGRFRGTCTCTNT